MPQHTPHFDDRGRLVAPKFDDVYFSAVDGLAETRHVFLAGNRLADRFAALSPAAHFTIGETGFGTGLNFLAAWQHFEQQAPEDARLDFLSVEGFPLEAQTMRRALLPWPELERYREALVTQWRPLGRGLHRFPFDGGRVRLTVLVGEAAEVLSVIDSRIDAWFLDGFAPSRNPDMWSPEVFDEIERLSNAGATLATYTAAGRVRRGLSAAGFEIKKQQGFGTKRDMTVGVLARPRSVPRKAITSALVVGGAIAGSLSARSMAERGVGVTVVDCQERAGGEWPSLVPRIAVLQPKISDVEDRAGRLLREGFGYVERLLSSDPGLAARADWNPCGAFHAAIDPRTERRLKRFLEQCGRLYDARWIDADETEAEVGLALSVGGLVIERAGILRPAGLCAALLGHPNIHVREGVAVRALDQTFQGSVVESPDDAIDGCRATLSDGGAVDARVAVLANAVDANRFAASEGRQAVPVRGQAAMLSDEQVGRLGGLKRALFFGGYLTPAIRGTQMLGASYVRGDRQTDWRMSEHQQACDKLAKLIPEEADRLRGLAEVKGWVGIRSTPAEPLPIRYYASPSQYPSHRHGSYGIASAACAAEYIACDVTQSPRRYASNNLNRSRLASAF